MTTTKRFLLSLLSFFFIVVSVCPAFAFAVADNMIFSMPMSRPQISDNNSGYIEVLFQNNYGDRYVRVYTWQAYSNAVNGSSNDVFIAINLDINNSFNVVMIPNTNQAVSTLVTRNDSGGYYSYKLDSASAGESIDLSFSYSSTSETVLSYNIYGNYTVLNTSFGSAGYLLEFSVLYDSEAIQYEQLNDIFFSLVTLHSDNLTNFEKLNEIITHLNSVSSKLSEIYNVNSSIYGTLVFILNECREYFVYFDDDLIAILDENIAINEKLDRIIEILEMQGESVQTTVDSSNIDEAVDIENSLLDNSNVDVSDVVNVEVNQNALTVIWDLVERFLNSHGKVFGMVLTVLSLGLVAMILGRKV